MSAARTRAPARTRDVGARVASRSVVSRSEWDAAPPRDRYTARGALRSIVVHHTSWSSRHLTEASVGEESGHVREVQGSHVARGFIDIGYHFVVMPSGRVFVGRPVTAMGAHVKGHNVGTLGIALAGDFDVEEPTDRALAALAAVTRNLTRHRTDWALVAHRDLAATTCPGDLLHVRMHAGHGERVSPFPGSPLPGGRAVRRAGAPRA